MGDIKTRFALEGEQQYRSAMTNAANAIKVLNAEQKLAKAQFENTGNAEKYAAQQADLLKRKIEAQKTAVQAAEQALKKLSDNGVSENSKQFQQWQTKLLSAQTALTKTETELQNLNGTMQQTTAGAQNMADGLSSIGKKISLEQVQNGINAITSGLEKAAQKAIQLGEQLFSTIMNSARWADDTNTMAQMYGIDVETFQQMQALVAGGLDTTVEAVLKSMDKLSKNVGNGSQDFMDTMKELGLATTIYGGKIEEGITQLVTDDKMDLFFRAGQAILGMSDAFDKEAAAQKLFGKSWKELVPLFEEYKTLEEYNAALESQSVVSEELIENGAELNDTIGKLGHDFETLKNDVLLSLAPALTEAATALDGVLKEVLAYLQTDEGKEKLGALSDAVTGLFSGLKDINAEDVASKFGAALDTVTGALTWIKDNKDGVIAALEGIFGVWATLKVGSGAITILKVISGLKDLMGLGGAAGGAAAAGGGGATGLGLGAALKAGLANVIKTLPFAAPLALFADGLIHDQQMVSEMMEAGNVQLQDYATKSARYAGAEQFGLWDTLTKYISVAGGAGAEDAKGVEDFAKHYMEWFNDDVTDTMLDTMVDNMVKNDEAAFDQFHEVMERIANGELFESQEDQDALKAAMENVISELESEMESDPAMIPTDFSVPDDAAAQISEQIGTVTVSVKAFGGNLLSFLTGGSHANGLPFVPYDGYLALLHQGERVLTASQNRSYTYNSNNYFGNVNLNNGQDIDALCDKIDRRNRRKQSGFGA